MPNHILDIVAKLEGWRRKDGANTESTLNINVHTVDTVNAIKHKPSNFLADYSIFSFSSFMRGFRFYGMVNILHNEENPNAIDSFDDLFEKFTQNWLLKKLGSQSDNYVEALLNSSNSDPKAALDALFEFWEKFLQENNLSPEQRPEGFF